MSRSRFAPLSFILLVLFAVAIHAQPSPETFSAVVEPIQSIIVVNETASFNITISNGYRELKEFRIEKVGYPFWDMYVLPMANPISVVVPPGGQQSVVLYVRPLHITAVDTYTLDTNIADASTGRKQIIPITVGIKSTEGQIQGYVPTVLTQVQMPSSIGPRQPLKVSISLNNQNALDYPNLTIRLNSALLNRDYAYQLGPKEEKGIDISIDLDPQTPPQESRLTISILRGDKSIITPITKTLAIQEYTVKDEQPVQSSFLKSQKTISFSSNNQKYRGLVKEETSLFRSLFTSTEPKASLTSENGQRYQVWNVQLDSSRQMRMTVTENYRPLVVIIAVIIILIVLYFVFRSPIVIMKEVAAVSMKEGGISEVKVIIRVRNRGREPLADIEVGDVVPHIAAVERETALGVIHPEKITSHHKGTILKWTVHHLEPNEGVILSYRMKSRLTILGDFHLPSATARCKYRNSYVITNSNRVTVNN